MLPVGKVDPKVLEDVVYRYLGAERGEVIVGPGVGLDAAVLSLGSSEIIFKSDPIVGAPSRIGWLAVNIVANDVACMGGEPLAMTLVILLPEGSGIEDLRRIVADAHEAALKLNVAIVGGHTEVAQGLRGRPPIVVASAVGVPVKPGRIYGASGARAGDLIAVTKYVAMEGTAILASMFRERVEEAYGREFYLRALSLGREVSVVREALALARSGLVSAMHDPTDGGLIEGLYEMAEASGTGFIVHADRIPLARETVILSKFLGFDPLRLISSGTLLFTVPRENLDGVEDVLRKAGVRFTVIGGVVDDVGVRRIYKDGEVIEVTGPVLDELWKYG